jgi:hypothetical protein
MTILNQARIVQNAYVVNNLEAACQRWNHIYGIGPFLASRHFVLQMEYDDARVDVELAGAFVQSGEIVIELLQQLNDVPSPFRQIYPPGHEGFHHVAVFAKDFEQERNRFKAAGFRIAGEFDYAPGCQICYIDTVAALGHMIELYSEHDAIRRMYTASRTAAETWDGKNLIHYADG